MKTTLAAAALVTLLSSVQAYDVVTVSSQTWFGCELDEI